MASLTTFKEMKGIKAVNHKGKTVEMKSYKFMLGTDFIFTTWASDLWHAFQNLNGTYTPSEIARMGGVQKVTVSFTKDPEGLNTTPSYDGPIWSKDPEYLYDMHEVAAILDLDFGSVKEMVRTKQIASTEVRPKSNPNGKPRVVFTRAQIEAVL